MKKVILISVGIFIMNYCFAQVDTIHLKSKEKDGQNETLLVTDRPPQAVYFGLFGAGPIFSVIYDRRFAKKLNGFGFATGFGFWGLSGTAVFSIPVSINYLFGKKNNFIELAAGVTFATSTYSNLDGGGNSSDNSIFEHINLGYRYQPAKGGFFARAGISPLFFGSDYVTSFYLGIGTSF